MLPDLTSQDILLLKCFHLLRPEGKRDLLDYLRFIAQKQYRAELSTQVMNNPLLYNGLLQAARMCEREDIQAEDVLQKISQLKYMYYTLLEKTNLKYDEVLEDFNLGVLFGLGSDGFEKPGQKRPNAGKRTLILQNWSR